MTAARVEAGGLGQKTSLISSPSDTYACAINDFKLLTSDSSQVEQRMNGVLLLVGRNSAR